MRGLAQFEYSLKTQNITTLYLSLAELIREPFNNASLDIILRLLEEFSFHLRTQRWPYLYYILTFIGILLHVDDESSQPINTFGNVLISQDHIIHYLINNGLSPSNNDNIKSSIIYIIYKLYYLPTSVNEISSYVNQLSQNLLKTDLRALQINILSLLSRTLSVMISEFPPDEIVQLVDVFISKNLILAIKSLILSHDIDIQLLSVQVICLSSQFKNVISSLIQNDMIEFLSEILADDRSDRMKTSQQIKSDLIVYHSLCTLINLIKDENSCMNRKDIIANIIDIIISSTLQETTLSENEANTLLVSFHLILSIIALPKMCDIIKFSVILKLAIKSIDLYSEFNEIMEILLNILSFFIGHRSRFTAEQLIALFEFIGTIQFQDMLKKIQTTSIYSVVNFMDMLTKIDGIDTISECMDSIVQMCNHFIIEYLLNEEMDELSIISSLNVLSFIILTKSNKTIIEEIYTSSFLKMVIEVFVNGSQEESQQAVMKFLFHLLSYIDPMGYMSHLKSWKYSLIDSMTHNYQLSDIFKYMELSDPNIPDEIIDTFIDIIYIICTLDGYDENEMLRIEKSLSLLINNYPNLAILEPTTLMRMSYIYIKQTEKNSIALNRLSCALSCVEMDLFNIKTKQLLPESVSLVKPPLELIEWMWSQDHLADQNRENLKMMINAYYQSSMEVKDYFWIDLISSNDNGLKLLISLIPDSNLKQIDNKEGSNYLSFILNCCTKNGDTSIPIFQFYGVLEKLYYIQSKHNNQWLSYIIKILNEFICFDIHKKEEEKHIQYNIISRTSEAKYEKLVLTSFYEVSNYSDTLTYSDKTTLCLEFLNLLNAYQYLIHPSGTLVDNVQLMEWIFSLFDNISLTPACIFFLSQLLDCNKKLPDFVFISEDDILSMVSHPYKLLSILSIHMLSKMNHQEITQDNLNRMIFALMNNIMDPNELISNTSIQCLKTIYLNNKSYNNEKNTIEFIEIHKEILGEIIETRIPNELKMPHIIYLSMMVELFYVGYSVDFFKEFINEENTHRFLISQLSTINQQNELYLLLKVIDDILKIEDMSSHFHMSSRAALIRLLEMLPERKILKKKSEPLFSKIDGIQIIPKIFTNEYNASMSDIIELSNRIIERIVIKIKKEE